MTLLIETKNVRGLVRAQWRGFTDPPDQLLQLPGQPAAFVVGEEWPDLAGTSG
jgi:hypothetical protein